MVGLGVVVGLGDGLGNGLGDGSVVLLKLSGRQGYTCLSGVRAVVV